jgi:hypothetical protein
MLPVLEQDDTLLSWNNRRLVEFTRAAAARRCVTSTAAPRPSNYSPSPTIVGETARADRFTGETEAAMEW